MANAAHNTNPELANVCIFTHTPTSKSVEGKVATIKVDDVELPFHFNGGTVDEAKTAALNFYKENIFNKVFDLTPFKDVDGVNKVVLSLFSKKTPKPTVVKAEDKRHTFKDLVWYVKDGEKPVRISEDQKEKYEADGYLPGKKWAVALAKYEGVTKNKKGTPGYSNPIAGKVLIHRLVENGEPETLRVVEDEVADRIKNGWVRGRPAKAPKVALEAPTDATSGKVEAKGEKVLETEKASV